MQTFGLKKGRALLGKCCAHPRRWAAPRVARTSACTRTGGQYQHMKSIQAQFRGGETDEDRASSGRAEQGC